MLPWGIWFKYSKTDLKNKHSNRILSNLDSKDLTKSIGKKEEEMQKSYYLTKKKKREAVKGEKEIAEAKDTGANTRLCAQSGGKIKFRFSAPKKGYIGEMPSNLKEQIANENFSLLLR